ncbi:MAG: CopG family transcriptional regulator [Thermoproteota archaeon]
MSEIIAVKIPKELKDKLKALRKEVNWPEEIRRFLEEKVKEVEARKNMDKIVKKIEATKGVEKGFSVAAVREDREGR